MFRPDSVRSSALVCALFLLVGCEIEGTPAEDVPPKDPFVPEQVTPFTPEQPGPGTRRVVILHTNDEHSHLLGFGPNSQYPYLPETDGTVDETTVGTIAQTLALGTDDQTAGGLVRRQYLVNQVRAASADPVLLLSGGDVMMGTVFHLATATGAPDYMAMTLLGYDFVTLGNHEFDFGPEALAASIAKVHQLTFGGAVRILASNLHFDDVQPAGSGAALQALYGAGNSGAPIMPWAVKTLANGLRVGFLGLVGYDAALVAPAKDPIAFSVPTDGDACVTASTCPGLVDQCVRGHCVDPTDRLAHLEALFADTQEVVDLLRDEQDVDVVIALTHLGFDEDVELVQNTSGIDVVIGGHSHQEIEPTVLASTIEGQTIIVQAGSYGTKLGQLVLEVSPEGQVSHVEAESFLHDVDHTLDSDILGTTDLLATPPVIDPALEGALQLTGTVIGPVLGALNSQFGPSLDTLLGQPSGTMHLLSPLVTSDHDITGEVPFADTNLSHLVTDAVLAVAGSEVCADPAVPMLAVQANGVIRESLRFGEPQVAAANSTTVADVFRVLPLGGSPFEDASVAGPGYPLVMFRLTAAALFAGMEIGVTQGLESDSFFLSYAGARVTYDRTRPPFDFLDPFNTGRITKVELGNEGNAYAHVLYDEMRPSANWAERFRDSDNTTLIDPSAYVVTVLTNLYLAGFMDAFGLTPLNADGSAPITLAEAVLCRTGQPLDCGAGTPTAPFASCFELTSGTVPWPVPELKEWQALLGYLAQMQGGGGIPSLAYAGATPAVPRVVDATPE